MDNKMVVKPIMNEEWKTAVEIIGLKFHINKIVIRILIEIL